MRGKTWQAFINRQAELARKDARARRVGRILWTLLFSLLITFAVGLVFKSLGWI